MHEGGADHFGGFPELLPLLSFQHADRDEVCEPVMVPANLSDDAADACRSGRGDRPDDPDDILASNEEELRIAQENRPLDVAALDVRLGDWRASLPAAVSGVSAEINALAAFIPGLIL